MTSKNPWNPDTVTLTVNEVDTHWDPGENDEYLNHDELGVTRLRQRLINQISTDSTGPSTFIQQRHHGSITADKLSDRFCIGPYSAVATLRATTNKATRSAIPPLARRYRADRRFDTMRLAGKWATDTLYGPVKSLRSNIAVQLYSHKNVSRRHMQSQG